MSNIEDDQNWNRQRTQRCIQKFDLYANPVTLTYNQQKKFTTVNGAICTIISLMLLLYLVGLQVAEQLVDPQFTHSGHLSVLNPISPAPFEVAQSQMLVMTKFALAQNFELPEGTEISNFIGGVYVQVNYEHDDDSEAIKPTYTYSLPKNCSELYETKQDSDLEVMLEGYMCPEPGMTLQGQEGQNYLKTGAQFYYVVNSCESMNQIREELGEATKQCQDYGTVLQTAKNFTVEVKVVNSFFDAKTYSDSQTFGYAQTFTKTNVMPSFGQVKQYFVKQTQSSLIDSIWYDVPFASGRQFETYSLGESDFAIQDLSDEREFKYLGFVNYRYTQADQVQEDTYTRPTLAGFLWVIGGFLSLITRLTNFSLAGYQSFTIDKSLIKKIFSWKETQKGTSHTFFAKEASEGYTYDTKQEQLKETIMSRHVFRYNWSQKFWADMKQRLICLCCCVSYPLACCLQLCRRGRKTSAGGKRARTSAGKSERLYAEGISKLYTEIDLLEVVKQLRISRFMSSIFLTANQRELIKFQQDYALGLRRRRNYHSRRMRARAGSDAVKSDEEHHQNVPTAQVNPAPNEALLDFDPEGNDIDARLYENIVDHELVDYPDNHSDVASTTNRRRYFSEHSDMLDGSQQFNGSFEHVDTESDDEQDDDDEERFKRREFNTNMDDFLKNFGSFNLSNQGAQNAGNGPLGEHGNQLLVSNRSQQTPIARRSNRAGSRNLIRTNIEQSANLTTSLLARPVQMPPQMTEQKLGVAFKKDPMHETASFVAQEEDQDSFGAQHKTEEEQKALPSFQPVATDKRQSSDVTLRVNGTLTMEDQGSFVLGSKQSPSSLLQNKQYSLKEENNTNKEAQ